MNEITRARNTLYYAGTEYDGLLQALDGEVDPETGEITIRFEEILNAVYALQGEISDKVAGAACVYLEEKSELERIDEAIDRLEAIKKQKKKSLEMLKVGIDGVCKKADIERVESVVGGVPVKISYRKSSHVEIDNEADIPEEYWKIKKEISLTAIRTAINAGKQIDGAHIEESANIQIR